MDVHHIDLSSEGGSNDADNLVTLCGAHHRAAHRGELRVAGRVSLGLRFGHADGGSYGQAVPPRQVEAQARVFSGLRRLGFREAEVRGVLAKLTESADCCPASSKQLLRAALAQLTAAHQRR